MWRKLRAIRHLSNGLTWFPSLFLPDVHHLKSDFSENMRGWDCGTTQTLLAMQSQLCRCHNHEKNKIYFRFQSIVWSVIPTIPARMTHSAPSQGGESKHHDFFPQRVVVGIYFQQLFRKAGTNLGFLSGISHRGQEFTAEREMLHKMRRYFE